MAVTIDNELLTFYDKLSGSIGSVSSTVTSLNSKLTDIKSTNSTLSSEISANYQGTGKDTAISSFSSINTVIDAINASFTEGPLKVISESNDLISKITELKTLKEEIDSLENEKSSLGGKWTYSEGGDKTQSEVNSHNAKIDELTTKINEKETDFNTKHEEAKSKLAAIKAINPEISVTKVEDVTSSELQEAVLANLDNLTPGTYNKFSYTGKNGRTINYCIYIPASAATTEGLPLHLYMGGSGEVGNANAGGLAKLLNEGQQSTGIVVVLEATKGNDYQNGEYFETAKELSDSVVAKYKCDVKRISISGHSLGGAGCISMAEKYPDYFSVVVPVCGYNTARGRQAGSLEQGYQNLAKCKIRAVCGVGDTESVNAIKTINSQVKNRGGDMTITMVQGGHRIQFKEYGKEVEMDGKTYTNLLEYCLAQTKA